VEEADAARRLVERLTLARQAQPEDGRETMTLEKVREEPTFTPMTVQPQLKNPGEVQEALQRLYPPLLREVGIGGVVSLWFLIDREGVVERTLIRTPSEHEALDAAALAVGERMEFAPAYNREERVPVWVALDIEFESEVGEGAEERAAGADPATARRVEGQEGRDAQERVATAAAAGSSQTMEEPTFTPMTAPPKLRNVQETQQLLQAHYPPMLREAGIGGTASVWFFIDEVGRVVTAQVRESSGHEALDQAALAVARRMDFGPARNGDQPVAVWVALDISFEPQ
jgi:TonB family protein